MSYTRQDVEDDLTGILGGTSLGKVQNLSAAMRRAGLTLLTKVDPPPTRREFIRTFYDQVYDYEGPTDNDMKTLIDIRPQVSRSEADNPRQKQARQFDLLKNPDTAHVAWKNGTQYLRYVKNVASKSKTLDNMNALGSAPNTWTAGDDAENVALDTQEFVQSAGSIVFDVDGSGTTAYIERTLATAIDLTEHDEKAPLFLWLYIPDASAFTKVDLQWGNSDTVYWNRTVTTPHFGSFVTGWNLVRFDWNGATQTGTVDPENIDYLRVTITYDGTADTDFRVDWIVARLGAIYQIEYYSKFMFQDSDGDWQQTTDDATDVLNVDDTSYNLYLYELAIVIAQQLQKGSSAEFDIGFFKAELLRLYTEWKEDHPSEKLPKQAQYY